VLKRNLALLEPEVTHLSPGRTWRTAPVERTTANSDKLYQSVFVENRDMKKSIAYLVVAMLVLASFAFAQDLRTATLVGNVTDATGAVVPNAAVAVINTETQVTTRGVTNED
jgi:hypothetical protein